MRVRVYADGRLQEWISEATGPAFWAEYFSGHDVEREFETAKRGRALGDIGPILRRHLPRRGRILEAGCGLGRIVVALRSWGYDCVGVDSSTECIARARAMIPTLPVEYADVRKLDLPDGTLAGYISLGVIEHERSGPQEFLAEARRVLKPGGVAVISVPLANPLRRGKVRLGLHPGLPLGDPWRFHEYLYSSEQLVNFVVDAGLEVVREYDIDGGRGLSRDFRLMQRLEEFAPVLWWLIVLPFQRVGVLKSLVAHSHVVVAVKP